jgi:hypothetical protein
LRLGGTRARSSCERVTLMHQHSVEKTPESEAAHSFG